jgi:H+-transporting ATPase
MSDITPSHLQTDSATGLSTKEATARQQRYGLNRIETKEAGWLIRLGRRFWGPIPWMIEVAAILSASVQRWDDFIIIMIMLLVNAFVDFYQESKALSAIAVLKQKLILKALVMRDGEWQQLDAAQLVPGDIIRLKIGDVIPADVTLLGEGDFLQIDQSALTGESLPVNKNAEEEAYANSVVKQGEMVAMVTATALHTYFGKTVGLVAKAQQEGRSHFKRMVIKVGNFLIVLTLVMIAIIVFVGIQRGEPLSELLVFSLVLTISAIPVAMPAVLTVTMAIGAVAMSRKQAIVSRLDAIEELAGMDILCSDKTGTLTQNRMSIAPSYTGEGFAEDDLFFYAALASREDNNDPIEQPIFEALDQRGLRARLGEYSLRKFIPFDPVRKRTEAALSSADGSELVATKGAPQVIIELCHNHSFDKQAAYAQVETFAQQGFRTLGVAFCKENEDEYTFIGLIPLFDPPREDSKSTLAEAKAKGVITKMITGDNLAVAKYIAKLLDIGDRIEDARELQGEGTEEYVMLARVIAKAMIKMLQTDISEAQQERAVVQIVDQVRKELNTKALPKGAVKKHESEIIAQIEAANGFAQVYPEDKYFIVDELQKAGHIVGMTGDGVNDAPALKKADVGIAVSGATDAARAAADIVLMAPGLGVIVDAIKQARITFERMQSYTIFRIAETIRIVIFMSLAIVIFQFYPVTAMMIIVLALLNDIPILAIAYDNTKVREKPVRWDMREVLVMSSWLGIAGVLSSFTLFWVLMIYLKLPLEFVQSAFFAKLVIAGHGTIYNTRIDDWFFKRPYPSWILFIATFSSRVVGTVIAVYGFGLMTPIGWKWALGMWAYALIWFLFNDAVKIVVLRFYRRKRTAFGVMSAA